MAILLHALAALVLGDFCLASFFERAHSGFFDCEPGFNHLIRSVATQFFYYSADIRCIAQGAVGCSAWLNVTVGHSHRMRELLLLWVKRHPPDCVAATTEYNRRAVPFARHN
jgi:hypothetical protein